MRAFFQRHKHLLGVSAGIFLFILFFHTPIESPATPLIVIGEGTPFVAVAEVLDAHGVITSKLLFRIAVVLNGGTKRIKAGPYRFDQRERLIVVAWRLVHGSYGVEPIKVAFPEGLAAHDMAALLEPVIGEEEAGRFAKKGAEREGYLFPETYFILPGTNASELVKRFTNTFDEQTADLAHRAETVGRSWDDVVIMASIVEEEARTIEDKRRVAGVLWKRFDDGMLLQVDAPFAYLLGKASNELTEADLDLDSPYNTYRFIGLPPTPISNPGLETLEATLDPLETNYWFYLSDSEGTIHYARTYDEHLTNKERYIE